MHVCAPGLRLHLRWAIAVSLVCCRGTRSSPPPSTELAQMEPAPISGKSSEPCQGRPRCVPKNRQSLEALPGAELVQLSLTHAPDAKTDEEQCDRREYWLMRATGNTLLATDCAAQYGPNTQGPAEVKAAGIRLAVRYVEFQESDRCELVEATINLSNLQIEREDRAVGSVSHDTCSPDGPQPLVTPAGDGSPDRPLLVLHRG
jgi:hypothetical protein